MSEHHASVRGEIGALLRRHRGQASVIVVVSFVAGIAESAVLVLVVRAAVRAAGVTSGPTSSLLPDIDVREMLFVAAGASVGVIVLHWMLAVVTASMSARVLRSTQDEVVGAYLRASWERQSLERSGHLHETIGVLAPQAAQMILAVSSFCSTVLSLGALLAVALWVDAVTTIVVVAFGGLLFAALRPIARRTSTRSADQLTANSDFLHDVVRSTSMAMELHSFGVGDRVGVELAESGALAAQRFERVRRLGRFGRTVYRDLSMVLLVGAVMVLDVADGLDVASFGAVVLLVVRAVQSAQNVYESLSTVRELVPSVAEMQRRVGVLVEAQELWGDSEIATVRRVEMRSVSYGYAEDATAVQGIDLVLDRGEVVGLVGPSGGGKSTIVQVLTRLRRPSAGQVLVDGVDYTSIDAASWTALVAMVSQEPQLMAGTIADNIRFWRSNIDDERVRHAARRAHVLDELLQLPDGLDTVLGPGGSGLSGGQKQRVAIARALVGDPQVLVLDEPTSALDATSESLIRATLFELKGTTAVLVVAHRPSTLEVCDRVVTVDRGTIVSEGSP